MIKYYIVTIGLIMPLGKHFGFVPSPATYFIVLITIVTAYLFMVQSVRKRFIKKYGYE
ncbi:MAG: hypothetical protein NC826_05190 [Candidatus Omnitrophica bacterium]|nr:hypothetical protein [Candidatus Omnitrophota bacterium]